MPPRLSPSHLLGNIDALAAIGAIDGGGCARLALGDEDKAGRDLVVGWMKELGLQVTVDAAGAGQVDRAQLGRQRREQLPGLRRVEPAEEGTEVGRLGLSLNAMLAQIEVAFDERRASEARLRRFVADDSHELRTPLTSICERYRRACHDRR